MNKDGVSAVSVSGFPGMMVFSGTFRTTVIDQTRQYELVVPSFIIEGFPVGFINCTLTLPQGGYIEGVGDRDVWSLEYLEITGPLPLDLPSEINNQSLAAWKDNGGKITVEHFKFTKEPLKGEGAGVLSLDDNLQPVASINTRIEGYREFINLLLQKNMIETRGALLAGTILNGLSSSSPDGNKSYLDIGISVMSRTLYAGPLAVAQIPPVDWGNGSQPASHQ